MDVVDYINSNIIDDQPSDDDGSLDNELTHLVNEIAWHMEFN